MEYEQKWCKPLSGLLKSFEYYSQVSAEWGQPWDPEEGFLESLFGIPCDWLPYCFSHSLPVIFHSSKKTKSFPHMWLFASVIMQEYAKQFLKCINKFNKILPQIEWCMSSNVAEDGRGLIHGDALFLKVLPITVTSLRFQGTTHIHGGSPLLGKWFANICCQPVISPFIFFTWSFTKQTFKNFDKAQYISFSICGSCFWYQIKEVFS